MHHDDAGPGLSGPGPFPDRAENNALLELSIARRIVLFWLFVPGAGLLLIHYLVWGITSADVHTLLTSPYITIGAIIIGAVLHELLHILGYVLGGAPLSSIKLHVQYNSLTAYVSCSVPISGRMLKLTCLLPLFVLGIGGAVAALFTGSLGLTLWAAFMISAAAGDVAILYAIRGVPPHCPARLHGREIGCVYYN